MVAERADYLRKGTNWKRERVWAEGGIRMRRRGEEVSGHKRGGSAATNWVLGTADPLKKPSDRTDVRRHEVLGESANMLGTLPSNRWEGNSIRTAFQERYKTLSDNPSCKFNYLSFRETSHYQNIYVPDVFFPQRISCMCDLKITLIRRRLTSQTSC